MKLFNIIAIFIYTFLFSIIGGILIALSLRTASLDSVMEFLDYLVRTSNIRIGMALVGFLLILINISIAQLSIGRLRRHKTIAFENPYGQVTVSLSAIEDYIKKLTHRMTEIKEIRSSIFASKSGIEVATKAVLYTDVNIPEATEKIQNAIRLHLEEVLGIEEKFIIKIHVAKLVQREKGTKEKGPEEGKGEGGFKGEIEYGR